MLDGMRGDKLVALVAEAALEDAVDWGRAGVGMDENGGYQQRALHKKMKFCDSRILFCRIASMRMGNILQVQARPGIKSFSSLSLPKKREQKVWNQISSIYSGLPLMKIRGKIEWIGFERTNERTRTG